MKDVKRAAEQLAAFLIADGMQMRTKDYLERGRQFENLPPASLQQQFVNAYQSWAQNPLSPVTTRDVADVDAEYDLRGINRPQQLVSDWAEIAVRSVSEFLDSQSAEEKEQIEASLADNYWSQRAKSN